MAVKEVYDWVRGSGKVSLSLVPEYLHRPWEKKGVEYAGVREERMGGVLKRPFSI